MSKRITFIRVALSFLIVCFGFLSVSSRAYAYTSEDGFYPINTANGALQFVFTQGDYFITANIDDLNTYHFNNPDLSDINKIVFYPGPSDNASNQPFNFPADFELFDYYLIGALYSITNDISISTFKPSSLIVRYKDGNTGDGRSYNLYDINIYNIDNHNTLGFGFSVKVDFASANNTGIASIQFTQDVNGSGSKPANQIAEFGILAVRKDTSELEINQRILNKLSEMQESITDSIGSAADQVTGSIDSATNSITSKLQESFDSLTSNLTDWFNDVFNGYDGTGTSDASEKFDQSAGELESVEKDLTNITNTSVDNYATAAFDTSIITTLGPSLVYVVTWFTNFWNMGGIFTSLLNVGLALFVAFFILRLHGGK